MTKNAARGMEDLITQFDDQTQFRHPLHELLGLDKALRNIRGSFEVEKVKMVQLEECIEREKRKRAEIENNPEYDSSI